MKEYACPKCGSTDVFIDQRGVQQALCCGDCGAWLKWIGKKELPLVKRYIENSKTASLEDFQENTTHELKVLPRYFKALLDGTKNFELRKNDRDYKVGDDLLLKEYVKGMYTGRKVYKRITYIFKGGEYGLDKDYVILSLKEIGINY